MSDLSSPEIILKGEELKGSFQPFSIRPGTEEIHFNSKRKAETFMKFLKREGLDIKELSGPHKRNPFSLSSQKPFWRVVYG